MEIACTALKLRHIASSEKECVRRCSALQVSYQAGTRLRNPGRPFSGMKGFDPWRSVEMPASTLVQCLAVSHTRRIHNMGENNALQLDPVKCQSNFPRLVALNALDPKLTATCVRRALSGQYWTNQPSFAERTVALAHFVPVPYHTTPYHPHPALARSLACPASSIPSQLSTTLLPSSLPV